MIGNAVAMRWLGAQATPAQIGRDHAIALGSQRGADDRPRLAIAGDAVNHQRRAFRWMLGAPHGIVDRKAWNGHIARRFSRAQRVFLAHEEPPLFLLV